MRNMKKIFALILGCAMLLGILAGCNSNTKEPTPTGNNYDVADIYGSVMLNANACVKISFDKDGKVLNVQEVDHDGGQLLSDYTGYLQLSCVEVVKELVVISSEQEMLSDEFNFILIKQLPGSKLPTETFLEDLATAAEEAAEISVSVAIVTEDDLDAEGSIKVEKAYDLLQIALEIDKFELVESTEELNDGAYAFNVVAGNLEGIYLVEADTGYVYEGSFETTDSNMEETEAEESVEEIPSETTQPVVEVTLPQDTSIQDTSVQEETTVPAE